MEERLHRFGFARDLREDAVTCCACVCWGGGGGGCCMCIKAQLVSSSQCRNV